MPEELEEEHSPITTFSQEDFIGVIKYLKVAYDVTSEQECKKLLDMFSTIIAQNAQEV